MTDYRITCIKKNPRDDTHHGIEAYGVSGGRYTREQMLAFMADGHTFYTQENGVRATVALNGPAGRQYLQSHADGYWNNNLLALRDCDA